MAQQAVSRRKFLQVGALAGAGVVLSACTKTVIQTVEVTKEVEKVITQVVQETVIVEGKPKEVTKIVELAVTSTPPPAIVTPLGKMLPADAARLADQVLASSAAENKHLDSARDIYSANSVLNKGTEPMLRRNENQDLLPALAESWTAGPGYAYWDFVIREGAKWSDGTPITADDWVYWGSHVSSPDLDTPWVWFYYTIKGMQKHKAGEIPASEVGVEKIDDRTVRIWAEAGAAPEIPALMAYQASHPVPKHLVEKDPTHWADEASGMAWNGPFILTEWTHGVREWWEPNMNYNGPHKPGIQQIRDLLTGGTFEDFLAYKFDQTGVDLPTLGRIRASAQLNPLLHWWYNFDTQYIALGTTTAPLNNLKLRQALAHAIDRETWAFLVQGGMKVPAVSMLPPGFPAHNGEELKQYQSFDVAKAKALLAEAGYPEGKDASGKQLELTYTSAGRDAQAEFCKAQWETNLGISLVLEVVDGSVRAQRLQARELQIFGGSYEYDYIDPANLLTMLWQSKDEKGSPRHAWVNPTFDELTKKAATELDPEKRLGIFMDAEKILVEEVGAIFMTHSVVYQIWHPYLTGVPASKDGLIAWRWLDLTITQAYLRDDVNEYRPTPTK